jgi:hypothetical protein
LFVVPAPTGPEIAPGAFSVQYLLLVLLYLFRSISISAMHSQRRLMAGMPRYSTGFTTC